MERAIREFQLRAVRRPARGSRSVPPWRSGIPLSHAAPRQAPPCRTLAPPTRPAGDTLYRRSHIHTRVRLTTSLGRKGLLMAAQCASQRQHARCEASAGRRGGVKGTPTPPWTELAWAGGQTGNTLDSRLRGLGAAVRAVRSASTAKWRHGGAALPPSTTAAGHRLGHRPRSAIVDGARQPAPRDRVAADWGRRGGRGVRASDKPRWTVDTLQTAWIVGWRGGMMLPSKA